MSSSVDSDRVTDSVMGLGLGVGDGLGVRDGVGVGDVTTPSGCRRSIPHGS